MGVPPRGGGGLKLVLLGLVAALAIGFFAFSLTSFLNDSQETAGPTPLPTPGEVSPPPDTPEPTPTPESPAPSPESPAPSPEPPSPTPSTPQPTDPQPPSPEPPSPQPTPSQRPSYPPTGVPKPNKKPPALPEPRTWDQVDAWLVKNALYKRSVKNTRCTVGRIDHQTVSVKELQDHLNTLTGCLMMVWQKPMKDSGFKLPRPPLTVYTDSITTACGTASGYNAAYCAGDQRIYYAHKLHEVFTGIRPEVVDNAFFPDYIVAHEFGHAIQARTGIRIAMYLDQYRAKDDKKRLELSRRLELQADCFAGMFLNAVAKASYLTKADRADVIELAAAGGDDSLSGNPDIAGDHGRGANRKRWVSAGLDSTKVSMCRTFSAPAKEVR